MAANGLPFESDAKLFAKQAAQYLLYRPTYPPELFQAIIDFGSLQSPERRQLAVDIATGQGQAAVALAEQFEHVQALDGSAEQLAHAQAHERISYRQADAHDTGIADSAADVVTVAQALHWFDIPRFYAEARRILKPHGVLAVWTYPLEVLESEEHPANAVLQHMFDGVLGPYWSPKRKIVDACYEGVKPGLDEFQAVESRSFFVKEKQTIAHVVGHVSSWSAYNTFRAQHPDRPDPLVDFQAQLLSACGTTSVNTELTVIIKLVMFMARGPRK